MNLESKFKNALFSRIYNDFPMRAAVQIKQLTNLFKVKTQRIYLYSTNNNKNCLKTLYKTWNLKFLKESTDASKENFH